MKQSCFTEEQIMGMWKEGEAGVPVKVSSHGTAFVPWARRPGSKENPRHRPTASERLTMKAWGIGRDSCKEHQP